MYSAVILHVPDCTEVEGFIEHVRVPITEIFDVVQEQVFKAVGCCNVIKIMPQLAY